MADVLTPLHAGRRERLKFLSARAGGVSAFATLVGLHRGTVYDFLNAVAPRAVPEHRLESIGARTGCSLEWLRDGSGPAPEGYVPPTSDPRLRGVVVAFSDKFPPEQMDLFLNVLKAFPGVYILGNVTPLDTP